MSNFVFPPFLKTGDKVMVVSPSSRIDEHTLNGGVKCLEQWGLQVQVSEHALCHYGNFSGTLQERLGDLQQALDDSDCKAIFCSRGGYGAVNLLEGLDFERFKQHPKWLVGFSDITALHCLLQHHGFASMHAPMLKHLLTEGLDDHCSIMLHDLLFGTAFMHKDSCTYTCKGHQLNHRGKTNGCLRGGNLAVYYGLHGTAYDIVPEETILFVEDVGERPHAIERMFYNLKLSGMLSRIKALVIGQFTEFEERNQLGQPLYEALDTLLSTLDIPVCYGFPVGHTPQNLPLIEGAKVCLEVEKDYVTLKFESTD